MELQRIEHAKLGRLLLATHALALADKNLRRPAAIHNAIAAETQRD